MTLDRAIGIAGLLEGLVGIVITVIVAGKARQIQRSFDRRAYTGAHEADNPGPSTSISTKPRAYRDAADQDNDTARQRERSAVPRRQPRSSGPHAGSETADPDPATLLIGAAVVFVVLSAGAIWLTEHQLVILRIAAGAAIAASAVAIAVLAHRYRTSRALSVRWPLLLLIVDAVIALAPAAFATPPFDQGRFDKIAASLPTRGSLIDRANAARHTYGDAVIGHVLEQNLGVALAVVIAMLIVYSLARGVTRGNNRACWTLASATVLAAAAVAGLFTTIGTRAQAKDTWHAGDQNTSFLSGPAPPVAVQRLRDGQLTILVARCGTERINSLEVDGRSVAVNSTSRIATIALPETGASPLTVTISTTRYYQTNVVFDALPRRYGFVSARPDTTLAEFREPQFPC